MFKRHYIDEIEYPPSPICGEKPQFESNVTSFQFRQNASPRRFGRENSNTIFFYRNIILTDQMQLKVVGIPPAKYAKKILKHCVL